MISAGNTVPDSSASRQRARPSGRSRVEMVTPTCASLVTTAYLVADGRLFGPISTHLWFDFGAITPSSMSARQRRNPQPKRQGEVDKPISAAHFDATKGMAGHNRVVRAGVRGTGAQEACVLYGRLNGQIVLPVWIGEGENWNAKCLLEVDAGPFDFVLHPAWTDGSECDMAPCVRSKANARVQERTDIRPGKEGPAG